MIEKLSKVNNYCRLCNSLNIKKTLNYQKSVPVDNFRQRLHNKIDLKKFDMDVYMCLSCNHVQLTTVVTPKLFFEDYIYKSSSSPGLKKHFLSLYNSIISKINLSKNSYVLDVGCNDGILLEIFKQDGYSTIGIDPDKYSLIDANKKGIITFNSYLNKQVTAKIINKYGKLKLVVATNVYSHSDDMTSFTKCISELLELNGYFVFEVSYLKDLLFSGVWDYVYHEHLAYHSVKPLQKFLSSLGFELFAVELLKIKGGSIRCFAQKKNKDILVRSEIKKIISQEEKAGFYDISNFKEVGKKKNKLKTIILNFIDSLDDNAIVASYGASPTCTVISQELGYVNKLSFIIDDNVERQNSLSPGYLIPVLDNYSLAKYKPKLLIISAWRFNESIINKCKNFLKNNGFILIPNPEPVLLKGNKKIKLIS